MAAGMAENRVSGKRRKRKRHGRKKLLVNDQVEVRSLEPGYAGSWHPGTVVSCNKGDRHVKYDHVLVDDGSAKLVDVIRVSPVIDGAGYTERNNSNHRGCIRPVPPELKLDSLELSYGLCVDVYFKEAWWEGVVFDQEDGSVERRIFFPDLGDEMKSGIHSVRITQDWDEFTEEWKHRGTWLLLELIEEFKQELFVAVSVKQIWYDVRCRKNFKSIQEWTSRKSSWKELLLEVISDNIKHTITQFSSALGLPWSLQQGAKCDFMDSAADFVKPSAIVPVAKSFGSGDRKASTLVPPAEDATFGSRTSNTKRQKTWFPVGLDIVPRAESHPDAIANYCALNGKQSSHITQLHVRMHLKYHGWRIDMHCESGFNRFRYTSPEGKMYYSLRLVCSDIIKNNTEKNDSITEENQRSLYALPPDSLSPHLEQCQDNRSLSPSCTLDVASYPSNNLDIGHNHYPKAVKICTKKRSLMSKAEKYILAQGWKIHRASARSRSYLVYTSPKGKKYYSLRKACQVCVAEGGVSESNSYASRYMDERKLAGRKLSSELCSGDQKHLILLDDLSPNRSMEGSCLSQTRSFCKSQGTGKLKRRLSSEPHSVETQRSIVPFDDLSENGSMDNSCISLLRMSSEPSKIEDRGTRKLKRKFKNNLSYSEYSSLENQTPLASKVASLSVLKGRKRSSTSTKLGNKKKSSQAVGVLRSSKRVQQIATSSHSHQIPQTILSWLIGNNGVLPREKVHCYGRESRKRCKEGRITFSGIKCSCCLKVFSISSFVSHAGGICDKPAAKIFFKDKTSLLDRQWQLICSTVMRNIKVESDDELKSGWHQGNNDDICSVCHYGGELVLCDACPSAFHTSCVGLESVPDGDWFCPSCRCGICSQSKFKVVDGKSIEDRILRCSQCECKYHLDCLQKTGADELGTHYEENWFCGKKCKEIFMGLLELLGKRVTVGDRKDNLTWTILKPTLLDTSDLKALDSEALIESYSKLCIALGVMHECFEPIKGCLAKRDLIEDIIFNRGSDLNRLNFRGFYTVFLEKNDELITVATVRIFGEKAAELPLVGTRYAHRKRGMCRVLVDELEKKLKEIGVERLILPAVGSLLQTWTTSFGFSKMIPSERLKFMDYSFLDFQDTIMCQKLLWQENGFCNVVENGNDIKLTNPESEAIYAAKNEESKVLDRRLVDVDCGESDGGRKQLVPFLKYYERRKKISRES